MKLNELQKHLENLEQIAFQLPDGSFVPGHFHVTEVGKLTKDFIDCGSTVRHEEVISLQLWEENDYDHRLHPEKLLNILKLSEDKLNLENLEIEVEYQGKTINKYALEFDNHFVLVNKMTDCLAKDACGIPEEKPKVKLSQLEASSSCAPGSGCC